MGPSRHCGKSTAHPLYPSLGAYREAAGPGCLGTTPSLGEGLPLHCLPRGNEHTKSDDMWEGAGGDPGDRLETSPADCAPSYQAGSWQAVF